MQSPLAAMRRLHQRGPRSRGLTVDAEGVMLGPDCVLVRRTPAGYRCADADKLARLARTVFAGDARLGRLPVVLAGIAKALDRGDLVKAQLLGLELPIGELDDDALRRLRATSDLIKDFDPDQPRDERGRWTSEGGASTEPSSTGTRSEVPGGPSALVLGFLAPEAVPLVTRALAALSGPAAFLGALLIPSNRSNVSEGTIPGSPGLAYRNDEGILTLYHVGDDGHRTIIFSGRPDSDQLYRDEQGNVIGRNVGNGQGFVIDPQALPKLAEKIGAVNDPKYRAQLQAYADAVTNSEPRLCPLPSRDPGKNNSVQSGMYQSRLCGLPPDWGVAYNGARFDGCDLPTGTLLECKALGFEDKMSDPDTFWPWYRGAKEATDEMDEQHRNAPDREIIWYVAEKGFADFLRRYARDNGYQNITVIHREATPAELEAWRRAKASKLAVMEAML